MLNEKNTLPPDLFINRELSLLEFQRRVLDEALDEANPLLATRQPGQWPVSLGHGTRIPCRFVGLHPAAGAHPRRFGLGIPRGDRYNLHVPDTPANPDVTRILNAIHRGEPHAAEELLPLVYAELRRLAAFRMSGEAVGHTLQPTALVHEAWIRLAGSSQQNWENRAHFFAAAADSMRRILVDHARRKQDPQTRR